MSPESRRSRLTDAVFALAMIGAAAVVIWEARKQPRSPFDPVGAAAVPIWTGWVIIGLAALLLLRLALGLATQGRAQSLLALDASGEASERPGLALATLLLSLLYVAALPAIGFMASTVAYVLALALILGERTPRALVVAAAIAAASGVGLDWGFRRLLVDLP